MIRIFFSPPNRELAGKTAAGHIAIAKMLRDLGKSFREGLVAHREYERLKSIGVRHDPALRASLGVPFAEIKGHSHKSAGLPRSVGSLATGLIGAWIERSRQRKALAQLDDRLLRDIGLTRSQEGIKPLAFAGRA